MRSVRSTSTTSLASRARIRAKPGRPEGDALARLEQDLAALDGPPLPVFGDTPDVGSR
ncbi:MAG TPA: hypothetical protein VFD67_03945 [Gemmatimonadaceae bacterium]|jgi:hypothetical protein|nr:hypothetical protein [Gemmatimonadaceae bacterium]